MTGFIIGGTILGSNLCSLIGRCVFLRPQEKLDDVLCTLYETSSKVMKQEKLGLVDLNTGIVEH